MFFFFLGDTTNHLCDVIFFKKLIFSHYRKTVNYYEIQLFAFIHYTVDHFLGRHMSFT